MSRALKWVGLLLGGLAILLAVVITVFDWNWLKSELTGRASAAAGREISIDGDIDVDLAWSPRVRLEGVRVENADWGSEPVMASIEQLAFRIDLMELLRGRVVLPELHFVKPKILLEKNRDGVGNWDFGAGSEAAAATEAAVPEARSEFPVIGRLVIEDGEVDYRDPASDIRIASKVNTATGTGGGEQRVRLTGEGQFEGRPFTIQMNAGSLLMLRDEDEPYPLAVKAVIGETQASVEGTLMEPLDLTGLDLRLKVSGPSLSELFPIFGIPLPPTRAYALSGRLERQGTRWSFSNFDGRVGKSDLAGSLSVETRGERPFMSADLVSQRLDFRDLGGLIGAAPDDRDRSPDRLLPDQEIALERLRAMDMRVAFRGEEIHAPNLPMESVTAQLALEDGRLVAEPVRFGVAKGIVAGRLVLNGRTKVPSASADVMLTGLGLDNFFTGSELATQMGGTFGGRVELSGSGRSLAEMLGNSDGSVGLVMGGGQLSLLVVEMAGIDIAEALAVAASEAQQSVPVRCVVGDFKVADGLMTAKTLVIDTTDSKILGEGAINLKNETLDLTLLAHPKDASPLSARAPVNIQGPFVGPEISVDAAALAARGAAAVALGVLLTPVAALVPLIELGLGTDSPCQALIEEARKSSG